MEDVVISILDLIFKKMNRGKTPKFIILGENTYQELKKEASYFPNFDKNKTFDKFYDCEILISHSKPIELMVV